MCLQSIWDTLTLTLCVFAVLFIKCDLPSRRLSSRWKEIVKLFASMWEIFLRQQQEKHTLPKCCLWLAVAMRQFLHTPDELFSAIGWIWRAAQLRHNFTLSKLHSLHRPKCSFACRCDLNQTATLRVAFYRI